MEIFIEKIIHAPIEVVWKLWVNAADIVQWNNPTNNWRTSLVKVDFKEGGSFLMRMELKDGSFSFNYEGTYTKIVRNKLIEYVLADGRKSSIKFSSNGNDTLLSETLELEKNVLVDIQKRFCEGVVSCFKTYAETKFKNANVLCQ